MIHKIFDVSFGNGENLYYICDMLNFKLEFMENITKNYNFYVLVSDDDPENIRYVGTTSKKINERFS